MDFVGQRWFRWESDNWQVAPAPDEILEGSAALDLPAEPSPEAAIDDEDTPVAASAADAVAALVQRLGSAYREGRLSSAYTHELLGRIVLVTARGTAMTLGVASGQWYAFEEGAWRPSETPPSDRALLTQGELSAWIQGDDRDGNGVDGALSAEATEAIAAFLLLGAGTLPEPIATPWDPPAEEPPIWPRCPACERANLPGYQYCAWCGKAAPPVAEESSGRPEAPSASKQPAPAVASTLACPKCGNPYRPNQRFCAKCGSSLASAAPTVCPRCSAPVKATDRFCPKCGAPIH
ncbi:MAG: zinc ribbon domain-containing protein [Anaerolineae bacterium]